MDCGEHKTKYGILSYSSFYAAIHEPKKRLKDVIMKITRTSQAALSAQQRSQLANAGCKVCPCCGETKSEMEYFKEGIYNKGVFGGLICKQWTEGLFRTRHMRIDCYSCSTCGAQWESEAYEIE